MMKSLKDTKKLMIGKRMLINAVTMEESLAELLRAEAKILRRQLKEEYRYEEIRSINKVIKYLLLSLTMIDDRIQTGLELYEYKSTKEQTSEHDKKIHK